MVLKEFLMMHNFREYNENEKEDTSIIRINFNGIHYIEIGIEDWHETKDKEFAIEVSFTKELLDSEVESFCIGSNGILGVYLNNDKLHNWRYA